MKAEIPMAEEARCKQINKDFDSSKQICAGGTEGEIDFHDRTFYIAYSTAKNKYFYSQAKSTG